MGLQAAEAKSVKHVPTYCYNCVSGPDFTTVKVVDGVAVRTPVRFGRSDTDGIEVLEGLNEGDEVIVSDMNELWHARKVVIE